MAKDTQQLGTDTFRSVSGLPGREQSGEGIRKNVMGVSLSIGTSRTVPVLSYLWVFAQLLFPVFDMFPVSSLLLKLPYQGLVHKYSQTINDFSHFLLLYK